MSSHPTVGVEEEFLLVDADTGDPLARNRDVAERAAQENVELQLELTSCQVETATAVVSDAAALRDELTRLRAVAARATEQCGGRLLAIGLPPTRPHEFPITDTPRYRRIAERFGMIAHEQGICGAHVHVEVPDRETAVQVCNRLRPWLPILLAITANSAIYRNADTGYASWRSVLWARWPSAGPPPVFASAAEYDATVKLMQDAGAMVDDGMVYWDVRPSSKFSTVEIRVADVPATVAETVLFATLVRATVMTALDEQRAGAPLPEVAPHLLRAAYWKAARDGLAGESVDLRAGRLVPVSTALDALLAHLRPALEALGEYDDAVAQLDRLRRRGNGAARQLAAWQRGHDARDVVAELADATLS
ncbi:glutamate--cysteine ligase [Mycobacterium sp. MYCO198283]|uniref:glutamate--cysteine ligase 2 n=1 Tax=Mycobacterium sp. MYCO198283 TaxID=2883505 RepID=UPI001E39DB56|nr:glutamate--cysteine ligase [Mycobacterium sp. MYCO198283]MCG5431055.1 glutamate--cysteine ligase [Mycobacterium sp. MYCO198283]